MSETNELQRGREEQYRAMMSAISSLETHYGGVRGALLKKVRAELEKLEPKAGLSLVSSTVTATPAPTASAAPQTCRACGRELKRTGTDGTLVCMNGHRAVG